MNILDIDLSIKWNIIILLALLKVDRRVLWQFCVHHYEELHFGCKCIHFISSKPRMGCEYLESESPTLTVHQLHQSQCETT